LANPSHLEAVNPVLLGKVRAAQDDMGDAEDKRAKVFPLLLHGDAAFSGQGVVFECLGMAHLPAYEVGGTVHIIVNNQVGFTTDPRFSRSSTYCSDLGKMVGAPIVHVNGDSVEDVIRVCHMAAEWRQTFGTDFIIDLVCYRRFGHNEADQPSFTQPLMYEVIDKHMPVVDKYGGELTAQGVCDDEWIQTAKTQYEDESNASFAIAQPGGGFVPSDGDGLFNDSPWYGFKNRTAGSSQKDTGVEIDVLRKVGEALSSFPEDLAVHKNLQKVLKQRVKMVEAGADFDWAMAEGMAFGSLLLEGNTVRLSGQDVERGTFSHRHHVLHDQKVDGKTYNALRQLSPDQAEYYVHNSHLSEYAVLGFELGFSQHDPYSLILWEAQFGDFANTAQCIIDQFISSGEEKWGRQAGLVMLLPHGYEGMGPEHSSCRVERFLQMCDDDEHTYPEHDNFSLAQVENCNMQVVNCTTPANYFHALRRQVHRDFRKPLVVVSPKSLLRHPQARSTFEDMAEGTRFKRLIPETSEAIHSSQDAVNTDVKRLVLCTGKVYYELLEMREANQLEDVAIARVEQISPFPFDLVKMHADNFPNAEVVWCQEEPKNMGCWGYVRRRIETALNETEHHTGRRPRYVGRIPSASTATGDKYVHKAEQSSLVEQAILNEFEGSPRSSRVELA